MKSSNIEAVDETTPVHGEKMIEVRLRFWTDGIAPKGRIKPRHAWDSGVIVMGTNDSHGLKQHSPMPFNSILEIPSVLADLLVREGVTLHANNKLGKLIR